MKLDWAMLADAAQIREGLAFVIGGGIDTVNYQAPASPVLNATILIRLLFHPTETGAPHTFEVRINDEDGKELARVNGSAIVQQPPDLPVGWEIPSMLALNVFGLALPRDGRYTVEILGDSGHLKTLNFRVRSSSA
jgi:hypothetical protein